MCAIRKSKLKMPPHLSTKCLSRRTTQSVFFYIVLPFTVCAAPETVQFLLFWHNGHRFAAAPFTIWTYKVQDAPGFKLSFIPSWKCETTGALKVSDMTHDKTFSAQFSRGSRESSEDGSRKFRVHAGSLFSLIIYQRRAQLRESPISLECKLNACM